MRIVIISDWFAEKTGYVEDCLSKGISYEGYQYRRGSP